MKTSKIIFVALLSTIALFMLAVAADIRITGVKGSSFQNNNYRLIKKTVPAFRVLSLNDRGHVELIKSDSTYLELRYMKDSVAPELNFHLTGDTLSITGQKKKSENDLMFRIHTTGELKKIISINTRLNFGNFNATGLTIDLDDCNLNIDQGENNNTSFQNLEINAKNHSNIYTGDIRVDSLKVNLQKSDARFMIQLQKISGSVTDSSSVSLSQVEDISLKKDKSSEIHVYN
jgi:hypothetical protein